MISEQQARNFAISHALIEAQIDAKDNNHEVLIFSCIGEPFCYLANDDAVEAIGNGCSLCETYIVRPDGSYDLVKQVKGEA